MDLNHTFWQQLHENEWLFVAPVLDVLTVLCVKHEPMDVTLSGRGRLQLKPMCKAYGSRMFIQSHATIVSNHTNKDIIPPVSLEYDCCDSMSKNFRLNRLRLQIPLGSVAGSFVDLKIASHKVEDVERLIFEQDWKIKHFSVDTHMPFSSYVGMITTGLTLICFCYCYCFKCCCKRCFKSTKWWKHNNPCTTIIFNLRIVTSIHSSGENVRGPESRASGRRRRSLTEAANTSKFVCLNTEERSAMPTGKH